jgi:hypothetical protein
MGIDEDEGAKFCVESAKGRVYAPRLAESGAVCLGVGGKERESG